MGTGLKTLMLRRLRRARGARTAPIAVVIEEGRDSAIVRYAGKEIRLRAAGSGDAAWGTGDFALFLLGAISMSRGWHFVYEGPVSRSAATQMRRFGMVMRKLLGDDLYPLRLTLPTVAEASPPSGAGRVLALSGGVDSVYAALKNRERLTHLMYVDGDGYVSGEEARFAESRRRAAAIADALRLELLIVETNAREHFAAWRMLHTAMLATCLHFAGRGLGGGAIAADLPPYDELCALPWGNLAGLVACFGTDRFGVDYLGNEATRAGKLAALAEAAPDLFAQITVCNDPAVAGGNCGRCEKCLRTRFALVPIEPAALRSQCEARLFAGDFDALAYVRGFAIPKDRPSQIHAFQDLDQVSRKLPPGQLRDEIDTLIERLFHRFTRG